MLSITGQAQPAFPDSLKTTLENDSNSVVQEKVYLHTDKTFYLVGETIWFKGYVVKSDTHQPLDISKVLYVELLDQQLKPVAQAMVNLVDGTGDGSFVLPTSFHSGSYLLRAYTAWMKNFDAQFYFHLPLQVVNTTRRPNWNAYEKKKAYAIRFFPEGGNLVEGLKTKLGFQFLDQYGKGVDGTGYIIENAVDSVVRFQSLKFGIGSMVFTPEKGASYKAFIRFPNGDTLTGMLPPIQKNGYVLKLTNANNNQIQIEAAAAGDSEMPVVYFLAHTGGKLSFTSIKRLINQKAEWTLDKGSIGEGITTFTLFDENLRPVCERLYFKRPTQPLHIDLETDLPEYEKRTKVTVAMRIQDSLGQHAKGSFSCSVFLLDSLQGLPQSSIETYLWLASELKGRIEQPDYYITENSKEADEALDNLMLTHGWRRFTGEDRKAKKKFSFRFLPEYEGHIIKGKVVSKITGSPVPGLLCFLSAPGERFRVSNAVSDENGEISFVMQNMYGPVELIAQADKADSTVRIELEKPFSDSIAFSDLPQFTLPEKWKTFLSDRHTNVQVSNAFAATTGNRFHEPERLDTTGFYGVPDGRFPLDEYTRFPTMEEVMREVVSQVLVRKEKDSFRFSVFNLPYQQYFDKHPLLLLDGVPIFNTNKLVSFDPLKIKQVDVVARKYFWGHTTNSGIVSYRTYDGDLGNFELDKGAVLMEYNGLQLKREFYAPSYETVAQVNSRVPDRRNVLFWQAELAPGLSQKNNFHFFTSDQPGRYAIYVQGISRDGRCGSRWIIITVK